MSLRLVALLLLPLLAPGAARAEGVAWPVRLNLTLPLGYTWGTERLHGFTWGLRGTAHVYPTARGTALGGYAEMLLDAKAHSSPSFGASASFPLRVGIEDALDWRMGGYTGVRWASESAGRAARLATGVFNSLEMPAYLYDFRVGLRLDATLGEPLTLSLLFELDLAALLALLAAGSR